MKIVQVITDNREAFKQYDKEEPWFGTAPEALLQGFAGIPGIEVHVISCTQQPMRSPERLAPNTFFHSLHVPKVGWLRTAYSGCIRAIGRRINELDPDIVHAQGVERECAIAGAFVTRPKVLTIHGNLREIHRQIGLTPFSPMWVQMQLEEWTVRRYDGVVAITDYTSKLVGSEARRLWVVPNAVDASFFEIEARQPHSPRVLCVANIERRKNQVFLIQSLAGWAAANNVEIMFYGSMPDTPYSREFQQLMSQHPFCRYGGRIGRAELKTALSEASLLVLPSIEDNCPMVILEAMAAGVPVAAAKVGGIPGLIREGETGTLLDPRDADSVLTAVRSLLENPALASDISRRAKAEALVRFHPAKVASRHMEIYRELLSG